MYVIGSGIHKENNLHRPVQGLTDWRDEWLLAGDRKTFIWYRLIKNELLQLHLIFLSYSEIDPTWVIRVRACNHMTLELTYSSIPCVYRCVSLQLTIRVCVWVNNVFKKSMLANSRLKNERNIILCYM